MDNAEFRKRFKKPLIKSVDMLQENSQEAVEIARRITHNSAGHR